MTTVYSIEFYATKMHFFIYLILKLNASRLIINSRYSPSVPVVGCTK